MSTIVVAQREDIVSQKVKNLAQGKRLPQIEGIRGISEQFNSSISMLGHELASGRCLMPLSSISLHGNRFGMGDMGRTSSVDVSHLGTTSSELVRIRPIPFQFADCNARPRAHAGSFPFQLLR
jgi:hypothetical protein